MMLNVITFTIPPDDVYVFQFTDECAAMVLAVCEEFAENEELSFNWLHASAVTSKIRKMFKLDEKQS